jgi:hypothetical protein
VVGIVAGGGSVGFVGNSSDDLVGNDAGSSFGGAEWMETYRPEWKRRGSLCLSSANSKKALSGLTAFLRLDHSGKCLAPRRASLSIEETRADP